MNDEAKNVFDACEQRVELYSNTTNLDKNFFESDVLCLPPSSAPDGATFTRAGFKGRIWHRFRKQNRGAQLRFAVKSTHDGSFHPFYLCSSRFLFIVPSPSVAPPRDSFLAGLLLYTMYLPFLSFDIVLPRKKEREREMSEPRARTELIKAHYYREQTP